MINIERAVAFAAPRLAPILLCLGCGELSRAEAIASLDRALAQAVSRPEVNNGVMWVQSSKRGLDHGFAHGVANATTGTPMTPQTPFLSASVGKLFVAVATVRLAQAGRLSLDDSLSQWVPQWVRTGLPVAGGDAAAAGITVRMLLRHRSGLPCYFSDPSADATPRVYDLLAKQPQRSWTRTQLLEHLRNHYRPAGAPGEKFHYADTNYDLLGFVLEAVEHKPFPQVVREQVLQPLALKHTWYHALEPAPEATLPVADVLVGDVNLHGAPSLSADQAGGGLATTVGDLISLLAHLQQGNPIALDSLGTEWSLDAMTDGIDVGLGAWRIRPGGIFFALSGLPTLVGHSGSTGVWAYRSEPAGDLYAGTVNQSTWQEEHIKFLLSEVIPVVERTTEASRPQSL